MQELDKIIDEKILNEHPYFQCSEIIVDNVAYNIYFCNILEYVCLLYSDPEFTQHLVFLPERHYADADQTSQLYHDMYTGKWW